MSPLTSTDPAGPAPRIRSTFIGLLRTGLSRVHWYLRGMMGEDAYDKYLEFHAATHDADDHPPMSEREFWRDRDDRQDRNPQGRCC